jgi:hypothetical protein
MTTTKTFQNHTLPGIPDDLFTDYQNPGRRRFKVAIPEQLFDGDKALNVQSFLELNCKAGNQWETARYNPSMVANGVTDTVVVTGSKYVLLKDLIINFDSLLFGMQIFKAPTYTGGTPRTVYNMRDDAASTSSIAILDGATVTEPGTAVAPQIVALGTETGGNRRTTQFAPQLGIERVLSPESVYLIRSYNLDTGNPSRVSSIATWYEGPLSVDTPLEQ